MGYRPIYAHAMIVVSSECPLKDKLMVDTPNIENEGRLLVKSR